MLFILCMEPLQALFSKATEQGIFAPLATNGVHQRLSMFADDVMLFFKPVAQEIRACREILGMFGAASGLEVNLAKSAAVPIRCSTNELEAVCTSLACTSASFPCKYLGLPLTIRKATAAQFRYLVEQFSSRLPNWKAATLPKSGRLILILSVLCAIPIHAMMALHIPPRTMMI